MLIYIDWRNLETLSRIKSNPFARLGLNVVGMANQTTVVYSLGEGVVFRGRNLRGCMEIAESLGDPKDPPVIRTGPE